MKNKEHLMITGKEILSYMYKNVTIYIKIKNHKNTNKIIYETYSKVVV
jgi:hypothetical protein